MKIKNKLSALLSIATVTFFSTGFAGGNDTSFKVTVNVVNPCKIGEKNGVKFLYDCPPKSTTQNKTLP